MSDQSQQQPLTQPIQPSQYDIDRAKMKEEMLQELKLERREIELQQKEFKLEMEFQRKQFKSEIELQRKQFELEMERKQFEFEMERKQFDLQQREFEFEKEQFQSNKNLTITEQQQQHHQQQSITPNSHLLSKNCNNNNINNEPSTINNQSQSSHSNPNATDVNMVAFDEESTSTSTTNNNNNNNNTNTTDLQQLSHIILQIVQDYDAIKYLLGQPLLDVTQMQSDITTLSSSISQLQSNQSSIQSNQSSLQSETQLQLQSLSSKVDQFINHNEFVTKDECINLIKQNSNPIDQLVDENTRNNLKAQAELKAKLDIIFAQNCKRSLQQPDFCYQFENLPGIQSTCGFPFSNQSLYKLFYKNLVDEYLSHHLKPLKPKIESSKLYISSPSVLNGQWIQIQGDGAVIDMKTTMFYDFIKDGDNKTPFTPCDSKCTRCLGDQNNAANSTRRRYLIKFKWE